MTKLIVGLGNIGRKYKNSRHNIGFDVVDCVAEKLSTKFCIRHNLFDVAEINIDNHLVVVLAKPTTYMNLSGLAVKALLQEYNFDISQLLIVVDDFNLPLGKIRIRKSGSDGGHNGLSSIIEELETENFPRLRLGIGPLPENIEVTDFVLGQFKESEKEEVKKIINVGTEATIHAKEHDIDSVMTKYNIVNPA
ncbi:MAG: aminoacyl-tRNA hydrolase [Candidatus Zixiibacteriota bacterium]|nr:MAG: aminoacyl-tRNA hydrolase [candidate division Zixibacteria bacterium]